MADVFPLVQQAAVRTLGRMMNDVLENADEKVVDQIGSFRAISQNKDRILEVFLDHVNEMFEAVAGEASVRHSEAVNFESLSIVDDEELEVMVAIEGMIAASRNEHLPNFISFNTRVNTLFRRVRIDESNNPIDPEQLAAAFKAAIAPLKLDVQNSLSVFRIFNAGILRQLDDVLEAANSVLIEHGIIPNMTVEGKTSSTQRSRQQPREPSPEDDTSNFGMTRIESVEPEPYERQQQQAPSLNAEAVEQVASDDQPLDEQPELFAIVQDLLHASTPAETPAEPGTQEAAEGAGPAAPASSDSGDVDLDIDLDLLNQPESQPAGFVPQAPAAYVPQMPGPAPQFAPQGTMPQQPMAQPMAFMQPVMPQANQHVQLVDQSQLLDVLNNIQATLARLPASAPTGEAVTGEDILQKSISIQQSLGEMLQDGQDEDTIAAVDQRSSDVINLVTMLFEAIWRDESVPIPIKELIERTQITIIKVALADTSFFNDEDHPARSLLNEFAAAGIGWTKVDNLKEDRLYNKIEASVQKMVEEYDNDITFFRDMLRDFKAFRAEEAGETRVLERRLRKSTEGEQRNKDAAELVTQKIEERILGRELDPFVINMLQDPWHRFMTKLVLKEGPGSKAWKQAINTIDVLIWSVQVHDQKGDRERLENINPRLLNNLRKAFRIAALSSTDIDELIFGLKAAQDESFVRPDESHQPLDIESEAGFSFPKPSAAEQAGEDIDADGAEAEAERDDEGEPGTGDAKDEASEAQPEEAGQQPDETGALADEAEALLDSSDGGDDLADDAFAQAVDSALAHMDDADSDEPASEEAAEVTVDTDTADTDEAAVTEDEVEEAPSAEDSEAAVTAEDGADESVDAATENEPAAGDSGDAATAPEDEGPDDDPSNVEAPYLEQVDALAVGIWLEFKAPDDEQIRCKLAAKISAIDKFIFVNRQGVKVIEKTRVGLARELQEQSVRIISDGQLFSRALESVIGNLRDTQHEQQTGGAYRASASN